MIISGTQALGKMAGSALLAPSEITPKTSPEYDLISAESRGNSTTAKLRSRKKPGFPGGRPVADVTVSYADEPDVAAVADVLALLTNAHYGR